MYRKSIDKYEGHCLHPVWFCKREGCDGNLVIIGNVDTHYCDFYKARQRAIESLKDFPLTYVHGGTLSCTKCGTYLLFLM